MGPWCTLGLTQVSQTVPYTIQIDKEDGEGLFIDKFWIEQGGKG